MSFPYSFSGTTGGGASTPASATPTLTGANTHTSSTASTSNYDVTISNYSTLNGLSGASWANPTAKDANGANVGTVNRTTNTIRVVVPANYQGAINVGIGFTETAKTQSFGFKSTTASLATSATPTVTGASTTQEGTAQTYNVTPVGGASYAWSANEGSITPSGASALWTPPLTGFTRNAIISCIVTEAGKLASTAGTKTVAVTVYVLEKAIQGTLLTASQQVYHPDNIVAGYTGAILRVQREGDNAITDIGSNDKGQFDWATANTFRQAGTGGTSTSKLWATRAYDQMGSGKFVTFTTGTHALYDPAMGGRITSGTTYNTSTGQFVMDNTKGQQMIWANGSNSYGELTTSGINVSTSGLEVTTAYQMINRKKQQNSTAPSEPTVLGATSTAECIMSYSASSTDNFNYEVSGGNYMFRARRNKSALTYDQGATYSGIIKKLGWQALTMYTKKVGADTVSGLLGFGTKLWEHTATGVDVNTTTLDNKTLRIGSRTSGASGQATTTANMLWGGTVVTNTLTDAQRTWLLGCLAQNSEADKALTTTSLMSLFDEYIPLNTVDNSNAAYARAVGAKGNLALRFNKTTTNTTTKTFAVDVTVTSGVVSLSLRNGYDGGLIASGTPTVTVTGANTTPAVFMPVITANRVTGFTGTGGTGYSAVTARASITGTFTDTPQFNYSATAPYTGLAGVASTEDTNYANTFNAETNWGAEYKQSGTLVAISYRYDSGYDPNYQSNLMEVIAQGCDVPPDANTVAGARNKNMSQALMDHHAQKAYLALCGNDVSAQGAAIDPNGMSSSSPWSDVGGKVSQPRAKYKGKMSNGDNWNSPKSMISSDGTVTLPAKTFPAVTINGISYPADASFAGGTYNFNGAGGATNLGTNGITTALLAQTDGQYPSTPESRTSDNAGFNYMLNRDNTTVHIGTFFNNDEYTALVNSAITSAGGAGASTSAKLTALNANLASREPYMARGQNASYLMPITGSKIGHMDCSIAFDTNTGSVCHPHPDARFQGGQYLSNYAGVRIWFGFINRALTLEESQAVGVSLFKLVTPTP